MILEKLHTSVRPALRLAGCLLMLGASAPSFARAPGPRLGTFTLEEIPLPALKRTAAPRPVPTAGAARAMARVGADFQPASLAPFGWRLAALSRGFASLEGDPATLPLLQSLAGVPEGLSGLLELRPARAVTGAMQAARRATRVDEVLDFGPAPAAAGVSGKGVLIGVLDYGFDFLHPAFLDSAGATRFLGIWDPNRPRTAGAPFGRGQLKWRAELPADPGFGSNAGDYHGTIVSSVAAGSDAAGPYYGVAPRATLLGVNLSTPNDSVSGETDLIQGIQWIFSVADSLGMPCVINLSLGNQHLGPHDGTSLFDRFLDSVSGAGRIVVGAAGNDGAKRLHARLPLAAGDTTGAWCRTPGMVDLWGEAGRQFRVQVILMDSATGAHVTQSDFLYTGNANGRVVGDTVPWTDPATGRRVRIRVLARPERSAPENGKPHVELVVRAVPEDSVTALPGLLMGFRVTGAAGVVHAWNAASDSFVTAGLPGYVAGDKDMSMSEIGGTGRRILSAGAYVTTRVFRNYLGTDLDLVGQPEGGIATWSSRGPTPDGRVKPDIAAPGRMVVAAFSRWMTHPPPWLKDMIVAWPDLDDPRGRYVAAEGTSESAPILAGTVALMLEADPGLTPEEVRAILSRTAYRDAFTGPLAVPDGDWGYGKLDAAAAVRELKDVPAAAGGAIPRAARPPAARFQGGNLQVTGIADAGPGGALFDWRGRRVAGLEWSGPGRFAIRPGAPGPGIYFAVLHSPAGVHRLRVCRE